MISFNMLMDTLFTKTSFLSQFSEETTRFFHNFQTKRRNFFTIFKRNDTIFHNWSGTGPFHNFGKKTLDHIMTNKSIYEILISSNMES